ncbi:hypothetical protein [Polaribacter glomeratus]|uniref:Lipoprotein n=1 Tax=Polaribacter glomeratus TaxID=102 RepID=A0A2S7WXD5_9FLAO|nr:hypothetical protein [Polaribacter glomeratus]PQJ82146.1 hypothetical protein BTO16_05970 [Polaribacter glomeratus]TXD66741.1 hypothetical protein ESX12_04285 [Polaribacter glomeratus]
MNKNVICLSLLFIFQFLVTSCDFCGCGSVNTYERINKILNIKAWDTSGFKNEEITAPVNKNSFGLSIFIESELKQISLNRSKINLSSMGFSAAYACSCLPDKYINNNPISSIQILATNSVTAEILDVTDNFTTYQNIGTQITIKEYLENRELDINYEYYADDYFQIDMSSADNIPKTTFFTVKIFLKSGMELIEKTHEINFI